MMALCTAYPNEVCYFVILFRGFAVDKELNIVNIHPLMVVSALTCAA